MKKAFVVLGLNEQSVLSDAFLTSTGVQTEKDTALVGIVMNEFDTELEALQAIKETIEGQQHRGKNSFESFTILPIYKKA